MKNSIIVRILMSFAFIFLSACNDEEFYEKDFIETYQDRYDDENIRNPDNYPENSNNHNGGSQDNEESDDIVSELPDSGSGPGPQEVLRKEQFSPLFESRPVDILWVVDNSGSMKNEQNALAFNFETFINQFVQNEADFQMAIITTDGRANKSGKPVPGSLEELTDEKAQEDQTNFIQNYQDMIRVGTKGSGIEQGIKTSLDFFQSHQESFLRPDAYFVVVYVSDEEDQSPENIQEAFDTLSSWKPSEGLFKAYAIVNHSQPLSQNNYHVNGHERYTEMTKLSSGVSSDINKDFYDTLLGISDNLNRLLTNYPLSETPSQPQDIVVKINGEKTEDFLYDAETNSIDLLGQNLSEDDSIEVQYSTLQN